MINTLLIAVVSRIKQLQEQKTEFHVYDIIRYIMVLSTLRNASGFGGGGRRTVQPVTQHGQEDVDEGWVLPNPSDGISGEGGEVGSVAGIQSVSVDNQ